MKIKYSCFVLRTVLQGFCHMTDWYIKRRQDAERESWRWSQLTREDQGKIRYRKVIESRSILIANTRVHDSCIVTMASANCGNHNARSAAAEDTIGLFGMRQSNNPAIIGISDNVTLRKGRESLWVIQQMRNCCKPLWCATAKSLCAWAEALHQTPAHAYRLFERTVQFDVNANAGAHSCVRYTALLIMKKESRIKRLRPNEILSLQRLMGLIRCWIVNPIWSYAAFNNWNYNENGLYLAVSFRRAAQGILENVSAETGQQYDLLVKALKERIYTT